MSVAPGPAYFTNLGGFESTAVPVGGFVGPLSGMPSASFQGQFMNQYMPQAGQQQSFGRPFAPFV
jgi:hypothetical protein